MLESQVRRGDELLVIAEDGLKADNMLTRQELKRQEHHLLHRQKPSFSAGLADEFAAELTVGATKAAGRLRSISFRSPKKKEHKPSTPTALAKPAAAAEIDLLPAASPPQTAGTPPGSAGGSQRTTVSFQGAVTVEGQETPGVSVVHRVDGDLGIASPELRSSSSGEIGEIGEIGPPGTPEEAVAARTARARTARPAMAAPVTVGSPSASMASAEAALAAGSTARGEAGSEAIAEQETLAGLSAVLRSKQRRLQLMAVVYVQQVARAWIVRHRKAQEAAWAEEECDSGYQPRRDATGLTPAQSATLRKGLRSVTHRPRIVAVVGWQHNFGRVLRALDQRLPKGSIIFILSKLQVWERRRDLATSGMAELGGALEVDPFSP